MSRVFRLEWALHEPMLFVGRELGSVYQTEALLGHYAQVYALGLAKSPYGLYGAETTRPRYAEDLAPLAQSGIYLTPARPLGPVRTRFERFNAIGEGFRSRMDQGAVVDSLSVLLMDGPDGKPISGRAINRPQQGVWQLVERGMRFQSLLLCDGEPPQLPPWARLGKTSAKAKVTLTEGAITGRGEGEFLSAAWLCALDLPDDVVAIGFDLVAIPPVPILRAPHLRGRFLRVSAGEIEGDIPADLRFRFPS